MINKVKKQSAVPQNTSLNDSFSLLTKMLNNADLKQALRIACLSESRHKRYAINESLDCHDLGFGS